MGTHCLMFSVDSLPSRVSAAGEPTVTVNFAMIEPGSPLRSSSIIADSGACNRRRWRGKRSGKQGVVSRAEYQARRGAETWFWPQGFARQDSLG
ncbi:hypothetical protein D3C76_811940 [compost metagenome]